jgi:hypothetical protein
MTENCFYHIYNRGVNRENIFFEEKYYDFFLKQFDKYLLKFTETYHEDFCSFDFTVMGNYKSLWYLALKLKT